MDIRPNQIDYARQSSHQAVTTSQPVTSGVVTAGATGGRRRSASLKWLWWGLGVLAMLALFVTGGWFAGRLLSTSGSGVDKAAYQAVFLTNGQVYFGKLIATDDRYLTLSNIYYLQVQQPVQPADAKATADQQTQLVKLGNELHGPQDEMHINRQQVLFWENLKSDSKVSQAIAHHKP